MTTVTIPKEFFSRDESQRRVRHPLQRLRSFAYLCAKRGRFSFQNRNNQVAPGRSFKWRTTCDHFIEHDAKAPNISSRIYSQALRLLRRHVRRRAHRNPRAGTNQRPRRHVGYQYLSLSQFCDPEIQNLNVIFSLSKVTAPADHDVLWLNIAMNYSF